MAGIRIEFAEFGDFDYFEVIRSLTPMTDLNNLPSPIVTNLLTMFYVDTNIVEGGTYYYRVVAWLDGNKAVSDEVKVTAVQYDPSFNIKIVGDQIIDIKGAVTLSGGNATITDDYFIGSKQSPPNGMWEWYRNIGVLQFLVKGSGNVAKEWASNVRYKIEISGSTCFLNFYTSSPFNNNQIYFDVGNINTEFKKISIIRLSNGSFRAFVDDMETSIINNSNYNFSGWGSSETNYIGDNSLSFKYLRWYYNINAVP